MVCFKKLMDTDTRLAHAEAEAEKKVLASATNEELASIASYYYSQMRSPWKPSGCVYDAVFHHRVVPAMINHLCPDMSEEQLKIKFIEKGGIGERIMKARREAREAEYAEIQRENEGK